MSRFRQTSGMILSTILILLGCQKDTGRKFVSSLDGEKLFREIFLFQGESVDKKIPYFASVIQSFEKADVAQKEARREFCDELVSNVRISNPDFFSKFEKVIKSDNLYEIKSVLVEGSKLIVNFLLNSEEYGSYTEQARSFVANNKEKYDLSDKDGIDKLSEDLRQKLYETNPELLEPSAIALTFAAVVALVVWEGAAIINVLAAVNVSVVVFAVFWGPEVKSSQSLTDLDNDRIVVAIAENY